MLIMLNVVFEFFFVIFYRTFRPDCVDSVSSVLSATKEQRVQKAHKLSGSRWQHSDERTRVVSSSDQVNKAAYTGRYLRNSYISESIFCASSN